MSKRNVWLTYKERIGSLSDRLVKAQKPIRILNAINWDDQVEEDFFKGKFKKLPKVDADYYRDKNALNFDPAAKIEEIDQIKRDTAEAVGADDDLGRIIIRNCGEYQDAVRMLVARGMPDYHKYSRILYGSPKDHFIDEETTAVQLGRLMYKMLSGVSDSQLGASHPKNITADQLVDQLQGRFDDYFHDHEVHVSLDDGIVSDAAAGSDYVKVRRGGMFSTRDRDILEVHEGWVHIGTTLSGSKQRIATWLGKGPPCCTHIQEGLAVLMEIFHFAMTMDRARKINNRIIACDKAEDGADFLDVCEFYRTEGYSEQDCYTHARRIFRGGMVTGGVPFTKDTVYARGFIMVYNFLRTAIRFGRPEVIPFLFVGKITLEDVPVLYRQYQAGVIDAPLYLPPQFKDLNGLAVWMAYSNFLNRIDLKKVQKYYQDLLAS
ncbi:MAG: DUF1704 domain-containing protein [Alphaproteobacteria bacterium]|nr:DUF1704 domain-containing protein [Alphaproteobacteria bacterium]